MIRVDAWGLESGQYVDRQLRLHLLLHLATPSLWNGEGMDREPYKVRGGFHLDSADN